MTDSRTTAKVTLTPAQRERQKKLAAYKKNNARVRAENAARKKAANQKALAAKKAKAKATKIRAANTAHMKKLTPAQRKAAIASEQNRTGRKTGRVGPVIPKRLSPARQHYVKQERKLVQTIDGKITPAEQRRRKAAASPAAMAKYDREQKKKAASAKKTKPVVKDTKKVVLKKKPETKKPVVKKKPEIKLKAPKTTYKAPASRGPAPTTTKSKAYAKDARNKEYDRLRKAGKTKQAESLGKKISADSRKGAPKNAYRIPQGAERRDSSYEALKAMRTRTNANVNAQLSADRRNSDKKRRNNIA